MAIDSPDKESITFIFDNDIIYDKKFMLEGYPNYINLC